MVAGQRLYIGRAYASQPLSIAIEDTVFRVLLDGVELSTHARKTSKLVTRYKAQSRNGTP